MGSGPAVDVEQAIGRITSGLVSLGLSAGQAPESIVRDVIDGLEQALSPRPVPVWRKVAGCRVATPAHAFAETFFDFGLDERDEAVRSMAWRVVQQTLAFRVRQARQRAVGATNGQRTVERPDGRHRVLGEPLGRYNGTAGEVW